MFYNKFKEMCTSSGVSMSYVLDKAELSRGNLARWKSGIEPKFDTLQKISDVMGVSVWEFLDIKEEMQQFSKATEQIKKAIAPAEKTMDQFKDVTEQVNAVMQPVRDQVNKAFQPYREKNNVVSSVNSEPKSRLFDNIKFFINDSEEGEGFDKEIKAEKKEMPADQMTNEQQKQYEKLMELVSKVPPEKMEALMVMLKALAGE